MPKPKRKGEDVLREWREDFEREQREAREAFESVFEGLVRPLINHGLVDDVEPEGGVLIPEPPFYCGQCGQEYPAEECADRLAKGCDNCGLYVAWRFPDV